MKKMLQTTDLLLSNINIVHIKLNLQINFSELEGGEANAPPLAPIWVPTGPQLQYFLDTIRTIYWKKSKNNLIFSIVTSKLLPTKQE